MKINIFSYVFWPEFFLVNELAEDFAARGHHVNVQTSLPNYQTGHFAADYGLLKGPYKQNYKSSVVYRYPVVPRKKSFVFLGLNYVTNVIFGFFNLFRLPKADVYFFFATSPLLFILPVVLLKKITQKPLVIWYQDLWPDSFFAVTGLNSKGFLLKVLNPLIRFIYNNTDLMLLQSPAFKENLERYGYKGRTEILYNWAPAFNADKKSADWVSELPSDRFIITFAGNIGKVQSLDLVIEAAKHLQKEQPEVFFAFVGEGSFLPEIQKQVQIHKLTNVGFYGRKPVDDMPALFEKSSALLVSLKDDPTFNTVVPSKVQAYMTSRKPIIGFLNGVGAQVISEAHCGFIAPAGNVGALIDQIKAAFHSSFEQLNEMGKNGEAFFKAHFEKSATLDQLEKLLKETSRIK